MKIDPTFVVGALAALLNIVGGFALFRLIIKNAWEAGKSATGKLPGLDQFINVVVASFFICLIINPATLALVVKFSGVSIDIANPILDTIAKAIKAGVK